MSSLPSRHTAVGILNKNHKLTSFEVDTPSPGPTDVLVKSIYTGHTPLSLWQLDYALLSDDVKILSGNIVGHVAAKGDAVYGVSIGELVRRCFLHLFTPKVKVWLNSPSGHGLLFRKS